MIRKLNLDDLEVYWELWLHALKNDPDSFSSTYEEVVVHDKEWIRQHLVKGDDSFYLGAFEDTLIGMVGFRRETGEKERHKGLIFGMYVLPEWRGYGMGKKLIREMIAIARCLKGLEQLHLAVVTSNAAACQLYRSQGFEIYGTVRRSLKMGEQYWDDNLMVLLL